MITVTKTEFKTTYTAQVRMENGVYVWTTNGNVPPADAIREYGIDKLPGFDQALHDRSATSRPLGHSPSTGKLARTTCRVPKSWLRCAPPSALARPWSTSSPAGGSSCDPSEAFCVEDRHHLEVAQRPDRCRDHGA